MLEDHDTLLENRHAHTSLSTFIDEHPGSRSVMHYIKYGLSAKSLLIYSIALIIYLSKTRCEMYMRTGFLIFGYLLL